MKILVDSNILIYAVNQDSPKHRKARDFLAQELQDKQSQLFLAQQNLLETIRILTHPKFPRPMSSTRGLKLLDQLTNQFAIISPLPETIFIFKQLWHKYNQGGNFIFDLYLIATALTHNIKTIATDNEKDFEQVEEITIINPFASR